MTAGNDANEGSTASHSLPSVPTSSQSRTDAARTESLMTVPVWTALCARNMYIKLESTTDDFSSKECGTFI